MADSTKDRMLQTAFGVRLRAARKMAGLSLEELAAKIGHKVTRQAISKYEKGLMMPSPEVMAQLIEALGRPVWAAAPPFLADSALSVAEKRLAMEDEPALAAMEQPRSRKRRLLKGLGRGTDPTREPTVSYSIALVNSLPRAPATRDFCSFYYAYAPASQDHFLMSWETQVGPAMVHFREGEKLPAKSAEALRYRIAAHLQRYLELEQMLGKLLAFADPLGGRRVADDKEAEAAAREVRQRWDLGSGPIVNLLGLLEERGVRVFETREVQGFEGLSGTFGSGPIVPFIAVSRDVPTDRVRFTAAHELAHILCAFPDSAKAERLCQTFAAALLLPREALERALGGGPRRPVALSELAEIKTTYGISLQAIMVRAHSLGLVGDRTFRSFRETVNARGWTEAEPVEYSGLEQASRFKRLVRSAVAAGILDIERAAALAGVPAAELEKDIGEIF